MEKLKMKHPYSLLITQSLNQNSFQVFFMFLLERKQQHRAMH